MANVQSVGLFLAQAFGRLGASVKKLSKVVSEEVPGTLYSLKLSSVELSDLPNNLVISGTSLVFAILFGGCWNLLLFIVYL